MKIQEAVKAGFPIHGEWSDVEVCEAHENCHRPGGRGSDRNGASCWEEGVETRLPGIKARV